MISVVEKDSKDYSNVTCRVISIWILNSKQLGLINDYAVDIKITASGINNKNEYSLTKLGHAHAISLQNEELEKNANKFLLMWIKFISYNIIIDIEDKIFKQIFEFFKKIKREGMLQLYMDYRSVIGDNEEFRRYCDIMDAKAEGIEQGKAEGNLEGKFQVANNLLSILDDESISKATGLTIKQIKSLR